MRTHRIFVGGNIYGAGNIGDDAVLQGILRILECAVPKASITIGTLKGQRLGYLSSDLHYVNSNDLKEVYAEIKRSDCFISGGGTMIGDELSPSFPLEYNAKLISIAKYYGKRVIMLAIGANRLSNKASIRMAKTMIRLSDLVTVRDEESRDVCMEYGKSITPIAETSDPAFLISPKESLRTKKLKMHLRNQGRLFGVNVVNEAWTHLGEYRRNIARTCEYLSSEYGYLPVFFCNEIRPGNFYDYEANRQTAELLECEYEILDPAYYNPGEMMDILSVFEFVIGMRMHALIFSSITGLPFAAISRIDKVVNFMRQFGLTASGSVDDLNSRQLIADVEEFLENQNASKKRIREQVDRAREECWKNVDYIQELLNRRRILLHRTDIHSLKYVIPHTFPYNLARRLFRIVVGRMNAVRRLNKE